MRYLLLLLAIPMYAQFGAAKQVVNGTGAPASAKCASANNVGLVYARKDGAAAYATFYVCSNSAASTYTWELMGAGGGGGSGTVTSVDATGGVQTASGAAITATGTVRGAHIGKADTATTYTFLTGDRGKVVTLCNAAGVAVTLPNAGAGFEDGWFVVAKNICAGDAVITPTTATISGAATATISNGEFLLISSNGTNYEGDGNRAVAGSGMTLTKARTGVTIAVDTALILSRAADQAGTDKYCRSTSGNDTWACTLTPTLTAYATGGCVVLNPDTANTGAATLNVDALGAKAVVTQAGAALTTGDIAANLPKTVCYDGTSMVIQGDGSGLADPGGNGFVDRTSAGVTSPRTLTGTANEIAVTNGGGGGNPVFSLSPALNLATKTVIIPSSTTLPATCAVGEMYADTDATSARRFYLCEATDTWVAQTGGVKPIAEGGTAGTTAPTARGALGVKHIMPWANTSVTNPVDSTTYYVPWSGSGLLTTEASTMKMYVPVAGTITSLVFSEATLTTQGTTENVTITLRLNGSDTAITGTMSWGADTNTLSTGVFAGSVAVAVGDILSIKAVTPAWATNPVGARSFASIVIVQDQ